MKYALTILTIFCFNTVLFAGKFNDAIKAFEEYPGYVQPLATLLGTFGSNGWQQRSSIPREFSGSVSLPITIAVISDKDRSYDDTYVDEKLLNNPIATDEAKQHAYQAYTAPTILGRDPAPNLYNYLLNLDGSIGDTTKLLLSDGIPDLAAFNWLPLPVFQTEFSYMYTALKFRYIGFPGKEVGVHLPGVGVQHDMKSFLPEIPVNLSFFGNFAFPILNWTPPGDDVSGTIEMRGFSTFSGVSVGKIFEKSKLDLALEIGWEYSQLNTGGVAIITEIKNDEPVPDTIAPDMSLVGRNRIRASFTIGFNPGKWYRLHGGSSVGAEPAFVLSPIGVRFGKKEKSNNQGETE